MRHFIFLFLTAFITLITINDGNSQNRYWVNGTGAWDETNHWSETSGGKPGASVPTQNDNVIFDDNSFLNSNQFVQIKKQAYCNDFIWEVKKPGNSIKSSSFIFKNLTNAEINIYGSATINNNLGNEYYGDFVFKGNNESSININTELNSNLIFNSENGKWEFNSELKTSGNILLISGNLDLNDKNIECNSFVGSGTEMRSVDLGNSLISANKWDFENTENLNYTGEAFLISLKTDNLKTNLFTGDLPVNVVKAGSRAPFIVYPFVPVDTKCFNGTDGTFTMSVEGGTKPYTYKLKNNRTLVTLTQVTSDTIWTFTGLTADEYYAEVRHAGGGVFGDTYNINQPAQLKALAPTVTNPLSCFDGSDGEITANPSGGTAPYEFQWYEYVGPLPTDFVAIPAPQGTSQALSNIPQGIYRVVINDFNDCGISGNVFVDFPFIKPPRTDLEIPPQIVFNSYSFTEECSGASDGTIDISASGGTPGFNYYLIGQTDGFYYPSGNAIPPPPYSGDGSFTGLPAQIYETYAVDANGCELQGNNITITNYPAPTANAGSDAETCEEVPIDLGTVLPVVASVTNESSLLWDDGGAPGSFDDASNIHPTYTPAVGQTGIVTLTLTAYGNGSCASVNDDMDLTIKPNSIAPTSATVDHNNFCPADYANITLSYVGGTLGAGATAEWYSDAAFTIPVGSGQDLTIPTPAATTTYYVRFEGDCNITSAASIVVIIKTLSTAPTLINSSNTNFCPGNSTTLTVQGGSLGTGATWEWYSGSCGGTPVGTGTGITVSPATTTTYYVRAEGDCNTTACVNFTVTVKTASIAPASATVNHTDYCPGDFVNILLRYVGGTLGDGASAEWYSDASFTTNVGSGQNLVIPAPIVTTTYYVRFEGDCNTTTAASVTVTVKTESTDPTGIITDNDNFCPSESANLTVQGGSLGTAATWEWYTGGCGGGGSTNIGSGTTINVSPVVTTTYYVRAEGDCNNTSCVTITLNVDTESTAPISIITDADNFCPGGTANLTVNGGSLGTGATWEWYSGSCGGTPVGTGAGISVSPTVSTTYYVRAEGTCNTTACASLLITVKTASIAPTSATVDNNNFCPGDFANITLSYVGGTLGTGATAEWYSDAAFTMSVGSGQDLTIPAPATTTTYYVRFEGDCNNTTAVSIEVFINTESIAPTGASVNNNNFCNGAFATITLSYTGGTLGTGATAEWYSDAAFTIPVGSGQDLTIPAPAVTTTYYVRFEGTCNNTTGASVLVTIFQNPVVDILPPEPVVTCTNVDLALDGNTIGGAIPFASEVWSGVDLTPLSDPNIEEPIFNTSTPGVYSFTYTVIDANGCTDNDNVTITVNQSASAYAGADTLLCYGSDYLVPDADTLNCSGITWGTDGGDGTYDNNTLINPTYTPGPGDMINGYVKLVISAAGYAPCGSTTDTVLVTYLPELLVSIGKPTPFLIDATTVGSRTHIDVYTKIEGHDFTKTIAVSLVAPDNSVVELKPACAAVFGPSWLSDATYKFYNNAEDTSAASVIDECDAASGRYLFSGDWKTDLEGQDPANGAWRIRITDTWAWGNPGELKEATIAFSDTNEVTKLFETVLYADSSINLPINDKVGAGVDINTDFALPITGLSTSCFGFCDATAIVTATGGQGSYTYEWSTTIDFNPGDIFETNATVDLCAGKYYVRVTDGHGCWKIDSVVVSEPAEIVITNSNVTDVSCNGDTDGSIMLEFAGGSGNLKYTLDSITWYNSGQIIPNIPPSTFRVAIRDMLLGCEKDTIITIDEPDPIDPNFVITPISCFGFTDGEITSTPSNGTSPYDFVWSTGFNESGVNSSTISSLDAGIYTVTITDANLCELIADTTVNTAPGALSISGVVRDKRCIACDSRNLANSLGRIIVSMEGGTPDFSYNWTGPVGFTPVDNDTIINLQPGSYNLTVTDDRGCTSTFAGNVTEDNSDDILSYDVEFADESVCWNDSVEIKSTFIGPADTLFLQIFNEETKRATKRYKPVFGNPYTAIQDIDGRSTFQIIRIMNDYCKADFADDVTVEYFPNFMLDILDGEDGNALDDTIYLKGATSGVLSAYVLDPTGITFEWLESDESIEFSNVQTLSISPDSSAFYKVIATSNDDCIDTSKVYLEFIPAITPNDGFSPNDDGINDYWRIKFIDKFQNNIVTIYNRWGIKVFEQKGYNNDDDSKRWTGKSKNGKDLASGTYYYVIVLNEEGFKPITGPVTIIR